MRRGGDAHQTWAAPTSLEEKENVLTYRDLSGSQMVRPQRTPVSLEATVNRRDDANSDAMPWKEGPSVKA